MPVTAVAIKGQHVREFFLLPPAGPPERFSGLPCKIRGLAVAPCPPGCVLVGFPMSSAAEIHLRPRAQTNIFLAKRPCPQQGRSSMEFISVRGLFSVSCSSYGEWFLSTSWWNWMPCLTSVGNPGQTFILPEILASTATGLLLSLLNHVAENSMYRYIICGYVDMCMVTYAICVFQM
jgi:hypothetical protein